MTIASKIIAFALSTLAVFNVATTEAVQTTTTEKAPNVRDGYILEASELYGISADLIEAVIFYESAGNANAVSSCGAIGLMQVMPKWNAERLARLGITDLTDERSNIIAGCDIIAELLEKYNEYTALCAYNAGEYSKAFKNVKDNGARWGYSEKILERKKQNERNQRFN